MAWLVPLSKGCPFCFRQRLPCPWHPIQTPSPFSLQVPTKAAAATAASLHNHAMMAQNEARRMVQDQLAHHQPHMGLPPTGMPPSDGFPPHGNGNPNLQPLGGA